MQESNNNKRRIIVCLDGTWDSPSAQTNIDLFHQAIETSQQSKDGYTQYAAYFDGVGTKSFYILGGMFGVGISQQIKDAYTYLCNHYQDKNDEIWCIGFSRGAYAVRSLCGMIYNVGLLPAQSSKMQIEEAYQIYRSRAEETNPGKRLSQKFRDDHGTKLPLIQFLGCFDTVGALGVPKLPWYLGGTLFYNLFQGMSGFHDTKIPPNLCNAYHALSIHDQRAWFQPTMMECATSSNTTKDQKVHQVWFPGMHSDVGGGGDGNNDNSNKSGDPIRNNLLLPSHSLGWMMSMAQKHGLAFKPEANGLLLPSKEGRFVYQDSYKNLLIYQLEARKDRVIPPLESGVYTPKQIYRDNDLLSYMTQQQLDLYLSRTLIQFNKQV
ncbi:hypothetical protein K501DRAFT_255398 [Backusella circina FSU 941]|nr:hypothetical protein K501DRAFT_255398 [Backusella circina FSU 941]